MSDAPYETELKLRIPATAARDVSRHPVIAALKDGRARTNRLHSVYFDTSDLRLAHAGVAVRMRHDGRDWLQTVKGRATSESAAGLAQRVECEWRLPRSQRRPSLDSAKFAATPYGRVIDKVTRHALLQPVFVTTFARTAVPLRFDDTTTATLCIDVGSIHAGDRPAARAAKESIAEIEIELGAGDASRLFELALTLAEDVPLAVETRSKAARGCELVAPRIKRASVAAPIEYAETATVAEAMAAILRNCLNQIEANAQGLAHSDDAEWVHQMRVGVRRARCAIALLRGATDPETLQPIEASLRWLAGILGEVRDLDVFDGQTLGSLAPAAAHTHDENPSFTASIGELRDRARTQAQVARQVARTAIASPRFVKLLLSIGYLAASRQLGAVEGTPQVALLAQPARAFASELLAKRYRKVRRAARDLDRSTSAQRHVLRIQAKKLRYTTEFFAPLFAAKRARKFAKALAGLQRELGAANDASVAAQLAEQLAPGEPSAALVAGWTSARRDGDPKRLARAWRDVAAAKRFWDPPASSQDA